MEPNAISINRAPVLTLWGTVVAERLGFDHAEALTLGRAVAGLNAYSKGKALGIFKPTPEEVRAQRAAKAKEMLHVDLMHRAVPVMQTPEGLRAVSKDKPIEPKSVQKYLASKFGDALGAVSSAMAALADSRDPESLAGEAYALYEKFRPDVPPGEAGWGAAGTLSLETIRKLANHSHR